MAIAVENCGLHNRVALRIIMMVSSKVIVNVSSRIIVMASSRNIAILRCKIIVTVKQDYRDGK